MDTYILAGVPKAIEWIEGNVDESLRDLVRGRDDYALIVLLRKPDRMRLLFAVAVWAPVEDRVSDDELRTLLAYVWPDIERPRAWGNRELLALFRRAGFVSDGQPPPTEPLTIYRGVTKPYYRSGLSWTTDRERAYFFARRFAFDGRGVVYAGTVDPEHVLGVFDERQEAEIVVDPAAVRQITAVERGLRFSDGAGGGRP